MLKNKDLIKAATILMFVIAGPQMHAQSVSLKLYTNFAFYMNNSDENPWSSLMVDNKVTELGYFTPSVCFTLPSGNFHEVELARFLFNRSHQEWYEDPDSPEDETDPVFIELTTNVRISLRYEFNWKLLKNKTDAKFIPYLGVSSLPYYKNENYLPGESNEYRIRTNNLGITIALVPRVIFRVNERLFLDLNVPLSLADLSYMHHHYNSPNLPEEDRNSSTVDIAAFPWQFLFRFGLGVNL